MRTRTIPLSPIGSVPRFTVSVYLDYIITDFKTLLNPLELLWGFVTRKRRYKMTQPQNGTAAADDVKTNGEAGIDETKENGGQEENTDVQKQIEQMQAQLELLKKEKAGEARKVAQLQKEKEAKELANKTASEQLEYYRKQAEALERKEAFRQSFKEIGLNPQDFEDILNEADPKIKAEKFAKILKEQKDKSAQEALEAFKKQELEKKGAVPNPKNEITTNPNATMNRLILSAFGR